MLPEHVQSFLEDDSCSTGTKSEGIIHVHTYRIYNSCYNFCCKDILPEHVQSILEDDSCLSGTKSEGIHIHNI